MTTHLHEIGMLVNLHIKKWSARKRDKAVTNYANRHFGANDVAGNYNKLIIPKDALAEVNRIENEARLHHVKTTVAWGDDGDRLLTTRLFLEHQKVMDDFALRFEDAVKAFLDEYDVHVDAAKSYLGEMFNPVDYPCKEAVAGKFDFRIGVKPIPEEDDFRCRLGDMAVARVKKQIEAANKAAIQQSMNDVWSRLHGALDNMVTVLSKEKPRIYSTLLPNMIEMARILPKMNIMEDPELDRLCRGIEARLVGVTTEEMRQDETVRADVANDAREILDVMAGYTGIGRKAA